MSVRTEDMRGDSGAVRMAGLRAAFMASALAVTAACLDGVRDDEQPLGGPIGIDLWLGHAVPSVVCLTYLGRLGG